MTLFFRRFMVFVLFFEIILFLVLYCFGPNGLHVLSGLKLQKVSVLQDITILGKEITDLQQRVTQSQSEFAKEKIARERLLMKKDNETVYFRI